MSRVERRTPYLRVRHHFRKLADDTYAHVAVVPCKRCSAWKTMVCSDCKPASLDEIRENIHKQAEFIWNLREDKWIQQKWCDEQQKYLVIE